ncbi:hypothetical protein CPB83DRAFT_846862 [Crepidotus variabilis]|uniref:Uncharacterized protein n=1 Tax=Crepidotus variabilis TaxID=179855 RepID=A0A9P6EPE2_9AGAR|nr:hypothetical protein CPB83DRAFT_846862 [Crepidotus variabilis]
MFKRVEKRRRKRQEEDDLSLDDELKEIMGFQDTDSEESDSDSEVESGSGASGDELDDKAGNNSELEERSDEGVDEQEEEEAEDPEVSVSNALTDPVYIVSVDPDVRACIVCPGKLLKGVNMVQTHRTSKAHERRYKQFKTIAATAGKNESAWIVLKRHAEDNPKLSLAPSTTRISKRGEKKKRYLERQKAKRENIKQLKAKQVAESSKLDQPSDSGKRNPSSNRKKESQKTNTTVSIVTPSKKRRKFVKSSNPGDTSLNQLTGDLVSKTIHRQPAASVVDTPTAQAVEGNGKKAVADIVRSTTERTLAARSKSSGRQKPSKVS